MEVEEQNEEQNGDLTRYMGMNPNFWGYQHNRPSQTEHACCGYGFVISEDEEEEEEE